MSQLGFQLLDVEKLSSLQYDVEDVYGGIPRGNCELRGTGHQGQLEKVDTPMQADAFFRPRLDEARVTEYRSPLVSPVRLSHRHSSPLPFVEIAKLLSRCLAWLCARHDCSEAKLKL
jgi:hypothetical protein